MKNLIITIALFVFFSSGFMINAQDYSTFDDINKGSLWKKRPNAKLVYENRFNDSRLKEISTYKKIETRRTTGRNVISFIDGEFIPGVTNNLLQVPPGTIIFKEDGFWHLAKCGNRIKELIPVGGGTDDVDDNDIPDEIVEDEDSDYIIEDEEIDDGYDDNHIPEGVIIHRPSTSGIGLDNGSGPNLNDNTSTNSNHSEYVDPCSEDIYMNYGKDYSVVFKDYDAYGRLSVFNQINHKQIRQDAKRCVSGKGWYGRNWWWITPIVATLVGGTIYELSTHDWNKDFVDPTKPPIPPVPPGPYVDPTEPGDW